MRPMAAGRVVTPITMPDCIHVRLRSTIASVAADTIGITAARTIAVHANPLQLYRAASRAAPLTTAFATCWIKGAASDAFAQLRIEQKDCIDWKRNIAFGFFSAAYLGIGQHCIYNVAFTRVFGTKTDLLTGLKKVVADSLIHVPLIYMPLYYPYKAVILGEGSMRDGLERYAHDARDVLGTYWSMWPGVHLISFTVMPQELRIGFVATVSFVWLIYLSYASHKRAVDD
jgi:hypothetical protein